MAEGFDCYIRQAVEDGKIVFPKAFCQEWQTQEDRDTKKSLKAILSEYGPYLYNCLYFNDPVDEGTIEFKRTWFRQFDLEESVFQQIDKAGAILSVDPAFRLKETNDFSGLVVTKTGLDNRVYVLEALKKKLNAKDLVAEIFRLVDLYSPSKVLVETVAAQILLMDLLRDEMAKRNKWFILEEVKTSTKETKAMRIRGLIPHYANGRILHRRGLNDLEAELVEFPRSLHDDLIDALSYQIPHWRAGSVPTNEKEKQGTFEWWNKQRPEAKSPTAKLFKDFIRPRKRF